MTTSDELPPQTAMLLTQSEWNDLTEICEHYLRSTAWVNYPEQFRRNMRPENPEHVGNLRRQRELCDRIVEANE